MFGSSRDVKTNRIDEIVNRLAQAGRTNEIERELQNVDVKALKGPELESWHHLWGIAAFRRGDRRAALERFLAAREACPDSGQIAFSLGQEFEFRGDSNKMFSLFDECRFPRVPASYALAQARYAYLWSDLKRAESYIEPIFEAYWKLGIADDTFLYLRGLPFFSQTWAYLAAFLELQGRLDELEARTAAAASRLSDFSFEPTMKFLQAVRSNDYSPYLQELRRGTAYERTLAAVLVAARASTYDDAAAELEAVTFTENDFPWLADILLLAKCGNAYRLTGHDDEALVTSFFRKQPSLFEPDHAFNFRGLWYQERLKPRYLARRSAV